MFTLTWVSGGLVFIQAERDSILTCSPDCLSRGHTAQQTASGSISLKITHITSHICLAKVSLMATPTSEGAQKYNPYHVPRRWRARNTWWRALLPTSIGFMLNILNLKRKHYQLGSFVWRQCYLEENVAKPPLT